ncbi:MAG TPA: methyltransferase domain-containing protein [Terrimicrobiaceae bacterium]
MNTALLNFLACPKCHCRPKLERFEQGDHSSSNSRSANGEVVFGVLQCECGTLYPIIDGVPRFLEGGLRSFPEFVSQHRLDLEKLGHVGACEPRNRGSVSDNDYDNIRKSFSQEWGIFDYEGDKTWGWTLEERKRVFLGDVAMKPEELCGKRLLDAGCGNGTLTAALSDFDLEIVGLDLNDGLGRAWRNREKYAAKAIPQVQYVQGNLVDPPLREASFDLIYSSGVIHHTPSSKGAFDSLVRLTKQGGRLYVWVYGRRGLPVRLFFLCGRSLKRWISLRSLLGVCRALSPGYKVAAEALNRLGVLKFRSRTTREITLDLFDAFAPRYNFWHTEAEVYSWFVQKGFRNIRVSGVQKHGFGMYGDKI